MWFVLVYVCCVCVSYSKCDPAVISVCGDLEVCMFLHVCEFVRICFLQEPLGVFVIV